MKNLINPGVTVEEALRLRPLLTELFMRRKVGFWEDPHRKMRDLFSRQEPGAWENFLEELDALPFPAPDCRWRDLPVAHLLDYLTQNHREFFLEFVFDLHYKLDVLGLSATDPLDNVKQLQSEFRLFAEELRGLVDWVESHLYPRILRYEACLQDSRIHPEFHHGSLQMAVAKRSRHIAGLRQNVFPRLISLAEGLEADSLDSTGLTVAKSLESFFERLQAHENLEFDTLFPLGIEMERTLYNSSINGGQPDFHRVRGPMDSGITRLSTAR